MDTAGPEWQLPDTRRPLPEVIEERIDKLLADGVLSWGDELPNENDLARAFKVGRSSVRTGLQRLQIRGLVDVERGKGWKIVPTPPTALTESTPASIAEKEDQFKLVEVRTAVETAATRLAARFATDAELGAIDDAHHAHRRSAGGSVDEMLDTDSAFHNAVVAAAHSTELRDMYKILEPAVRAMRRRRFEEDPSSVRQSAEGHALVVQFLRRHDIAAGKAMEMHLLTFSPVTQLVALGAVTAPVGNAARPVCDDGVVAGDMSDDRARSRRVVIVSAVVAAVLLIAAVTAGDLPGTTGRILVVLLAAAAAAAGLLAVGAHLYAHVLHRWWSQEVRTAQSLALVDNLPPGMVLERLLARLYGERDANLLTIRGLLGGTGHSLEVGDLSISSSTSVRYRLRSEVPGSYELVSTVEHSFDNPITDHTLVLFATCDPGLRDLIVVGCDRPLFDWVFVPRDELFRSDGGTILDSVDLGLRYLDEHDEEAELDLTNVSTKYVEPGAWVDYLSFFRHPVGSIPYRDPGQHLGVLKIVEVDLAALVGQRRLRSITGLALRWVSTQPDQGACFWQAPFPCHLDTVHFDVTELAHEHGGQLEFTIQPFLPKTDFVDTAEWVSADDLGELQVGSWAHPGHGIVLLWRTAQDQDGRS